MNISSFKRVLVLAPHTDDAEFGCGGTIARMVEARVDVTCVAFSAAEESVPSGMARDTNRKDMLKAMSMLGVSEDHVEILAYPVRKFPQYRQEILEDMVRLSREVRPDVVFLPSTYDTHQDHQVISNEGFRAFKRTSMLGYEIPWNNLTFTTNCFINIGEKHVEQKLSSLKCYISQLGRNYVNDDFIVSLLRTRGGQNGGEYAEAFEVIRLIL